MTVSTATNKVIYSGDDASTVFPYAFKIFNDTDLVVILSDDDTLAETTLALGSDYSVTGAGDDGGGNVTLAEALALGDSLVIRREVPLTQPTEWPPSGPFPAASHEAAADRAVMMAQQLSEAQGRMPQLPAAATGSYSLPVPESGKALVGKSDATGWESGDVTWSGETELVYRANESLAPAPGDNYLFINQTSVQAELRDGAGDRVAIVENRLAQTIDDLLPDDQAPAENDTARGAVVFGNGGAWAWGEFEAPASDLVATINASLAMSTGSSATVGINLAYQVFSQDDVFDPVKERWEASASYTTGAYVIPATPNGHVYEASAGGTSATTIPTWPTGSGATVVDGSVTWAEAGAGMSLVTASVVAPSTAWQPTNVEFEIPVTLTNGNIVVVGISRDASDAHSGDAHIRKLAVTFQEA